MIDTKEKIAYLMENGLIIMPELKNIGVKVKEGIKLSEIYNDVDAYSLMFFIISMNASNLERVLKNFEAFNYPDELKDISLFDNYAIISEVINRIKDEYLSVCHFFKIFNIYFQISDYNDFLEFASDVLEFFGKDELAKYINEIIDEQVVEGSTKKVMKGGKMYAVPMKEKFVLFSIDFHKFLNDIEIPVEYRSGWKIYSVERFQKYLEVIDTATKKSVIIKVDNKVKNSIEAVASLFLVPNVENLDEYIDYIIRQGDLIGIVPKEGKEEEVNKMIEENNVRPLTAEEYSKFIKYER